jgi:hypothetical protein
MGRPSLVGPEPVFDREPAAGDAGTREAAIRSRKLCATWAFAGAGLFLLLALFAWQLVFRIDGERIFAVSDDIYISACYARNLAAGHGAVWYPGAVPVEGFSNPLWTGMLAVIHLLPFYREADLGLYVFGAQVLALGAALAAAFGVFSRLLALAGGAGELTVGRRLAIGFALLSWGSLVFWMAEGFEIGLVLALALVAFDLALRPRSEAGHGLGRAAWIGALAGLCLWTRMDGPIVCAGAFLLLLGGRGGLRRVALAGLVLGVFAAVLFSVRHAVFGEWMPNTYWLKLSGWPLTDRISAGLERNAPVLPALALAWTVFLLPAARRALGAATRPALALVATGTLGVLYSIHNGGDSWNLRLGFDRFSAPGAAMLGVALALLAAKYRTRYVFSHLDRDPSAPSDPDRGARKRTWFGISVVLIAAVPVALDPSLSYVLRLVAGKFTATERTYIGYGKALEAGSTPGARVLTGAAGAIVYFSHRDGSDFLGKCDPWVARQPVNRPELTSGHNKRYAPEVFRRDRPEFSREAPPPDLAEEYVERSMRGHRVWIRTDGQHVLWERL